MDGLNSLVQDTIQSRGDSPLPDKGLVFSSNSAAVAARSAFPGTKDLTYGTMAALLRVLVSTWYCSYCCETESLDLVFLMMSVMSKEEGFLCKEKATYTKVLDWNEY